MKKAQCASLLTKVSFGAAAVAACLQCVAMLKAYSQAANYFSFGSPLPFIAVAFALVSALCGTVSAYLLPAEHVRSTPFSGKLASSLPAGLGFALSACLLLFYGVTQLALPAAIGLVLAAGYSILCASQLRQSHTSVVALIGFAAIVGCALTNAYYYFDQTMEMNAPMKVSIQTALLFAMLYYTGELRYLLGREKPRAFLILSYCTVAAGSLPSLSVILAYAFGTTERADYFAGAVLTLGITITVISRLLLLSDAQAEPLQSPDMPPSETETPSDTSTTEAKEEDENAK